MGTGVSCVEVTNLDVRVRDSCTGSGALDISGLTGGSRASSTSDTRAGRVGGGGVVRVEPQHVDGIVVPDREDKNHSSLECLTHLSQTTLLLESVGVTERGLLGIAEGVGDGVTGHSCNVSLGVLEDNTILNVDATDLNEVSG